MITKLKVTTFALGVTLLSTSGKAMKIESRGLAEDFVKYCALLSLVRLPADAVDSNTTSACLSRQADPGSFNLFSHSLPGENKWNDTEKLKSYRRYSVEKLLDNQEQQTV